MVKEIITGYTKQVYTFYNFPWMALTFCTPPARIEGVCIEFSISQVSLQFSVHMNSVHTQVITTRRNMPNNTMTPQVIAVNKRLSPIKYPLSTILARRIVPDFFENRWFTFKDIDETDTRLQFVKVNG